MSCDLLPEWLNLFLDDVETTLCLPILLIMILCTVQFIINHAMDIGLTFYQNIMQKSNEDEEEDDKEKGEDLMTKIRGYLCNISCGFNNTNSKSEENAAPTMLRSNSQEEEWDYCEDDEEK
ncbi:PREDICTED: uncharacterized protein LOC108553216 [Eufriesea mexicana]|uniref:uncharacterized protein LOC108553216 n=1 Tax=Eufriesea mexicana TaxID=516756 RepID=UPI00083BD9FE|nr:PREDICTED: uncharacterized protein LOC108553216 [Eufriesea mexicana]